MNKENRNQGFSLVELIVIMAIMVILSTAAAAGFSNTGGQRVQSTVSLITGYLDSTKNYVLTKNDAYLKISYKNGKYYIADNEGNEDPLPSGIVLTYDTNKVMGNSILESSPLMLTYSRTDGSMKPMISSVAADGTFIYESTPAGSGSTEDVYCKKITIVSSGKERNITLYNKTGKYKVN